MLRSSEYCSCHITASAVPLPGKSCSQSDVTENTSNRVPYASKTRAFIWRFYRDPDLATYYYCCCCCCSASPSRIGTVASRDIQGVKGTVSATCGVARHDAIGEDPPLVIDVAQKEVDRREALRQAALDRRPLAGRDDARQQILGKDALRSRFIAVDVKVIPWVRNALSASVWC